MVQFCKTCLLQLVLCRLMFSSLLQEPCNMTYILRMLAKVGRSYRLYPAVKKKVWNFNSRLCMYICPVSVSFFKLFVLCFPLFDNFICFSQLQPHFQLFPPPLLSHPPSLSISTVLLLKTFSVYVSLIVLAYVNTGGEFQISENYQRLCHWRKWPPSSRND